MNQNFTNSSPQNFPNKNSDEDVSISISKFKNQSILTNSIISNFNQSHSKYSEKEAIKESEIPEEFSDYLFTKNIIVFIMDAVRKLKDL